MTNYILILLFGLFLFLANLYIIIKFREKINTFNIVDKNFSKPQAFHVEPTPRIGGLLFFLNFILLSVSYSYFNEMKIGYIFSLFPFFFIGFLDDIKILENPKLRITLLISSILIVIFLSNTNVESTGVQLLNYLLSNFFILQFIFLLFCFLTIINGCNFIDGFNGLLLIHSIIISFFLLLLNMHNIYFNQTLILLICLFLFLFLNFPKAKIFLGDSGAYSIGFIISLFVIQTSNYNSEVSPFFFCILLFYIFFEVLFSFTRKKIINHNPLLPDDNHLHMVLFRILNIKFFKDKLKANYMTSIFINLFYLIIIFPSFFFRYDNFACKLYFLICLILYLIFYLLLNKFEKKLLL